MRNANSALDPQRLLANGEWMRRLAGRLVHDDASADDIVQQAYLVALERPPRNRESLRPWLSRVVTTLAYRRGRDGRRRAAREERVARRERVVPTPDEITSRLEMQRLIVALVLELSEPNRTTLVRRFFDDLTPRQIASDEGVAVTTVRSRIHRGLAELRGRLDRQPEAPSRGWRAQMALIAAPLADLASGTSSLQTTAAVESNTGSITIMALSAKSGALAGAAATALLLGGAWMWSADRRDAPQHVSPDETTDSATVDPADDSHDRRSLLRELRSLRQERDDLASQLQSLTGQLAARDAAATGASTIADPESAEDQSWAALSAALTRHLPAIARRNAGAPTSAADRANLAEVWAEISKASAHAQETHAAPFFERSVFEQLVASLTHEPLALSDEQRAEVARAVDAAVQTMPPNAASLSGVEKHVHRTRVLEEVFAAIDRVVDPEQTDEWTTVREYAVGLLRYGGRMNVGVDVGLSNFVENWASNALRDHGADVDRPSLHAVTTDYISRARGVLTSFADDNEELDALTDEAAADYGARMLQLQLEFERELGPLLTREGQDELRSRPPIIILFRYGESTVIQGRPSLF